MLMTNAGRFGVAILVLWLCICWSEALDNNNNEAKKHHNGHHSISNHNIISRSAGQKAFESALRSYDKELFYAIGNVLSFANIRVIGQYDIHSTAVDWFDVFEEHMMILEGKRFQGSLFASKEHHRAMKVSTGWPALAEIVESIQINFFGTDEQYAKVAELVESLRVGAGKVKLQKGKSNSSLKLEDKVKSYCAQFESSPSLVFHMSNDHSCASTKEANHQHNATKNDHFSHYADDTFVIEFPSLCMNVLTKGNYKVCGLDWDQNLKSFPRDSFW